MLWFKIFRPAKFQSLKSVIQGHAHNHGFSILTGLQRPASKGTIRLQSGNPFEYPLIDPQYLHEDTDVENLLSGKLKRTLFYESGLTILINSYS